LHVGANLASPWSGGEAIDSVRGYFGSTTAQTGLRVSSDSYSAASTAFLDLVNYGSKDLNQYSGYRLAGSVGGGTTGGNPSLVFSLSGLNSSATGSITSEVARFDGSGRLLVGTSSWTSNHGLVVGRSGSGSSYGRVFIGKNDSSITGSDDVGAIDFGSSNDESLGASITARGETTWTHGTSHPTRLVFSTAAGGESSPTEQLRITANRYVRLASGTGGIQFNGDTAPANALDDYEEGTWDFAITTAGGSVTMNSSLNACSYTKIGRIVHVGGQVTVSSVSSPTGFIAVTLPFAPASLSESAEYNAGVITIGNSVSKNTNDFALLIQDNGEMRIYVADTTVLSSANANAQQLQANSIISFQLTYVAT